MKRKIVVPIAVIIASVIFMPSVLCAEAWKIDLSITSESGPSDVATFGIDQNATDGFDAAFDDFQAPIPPTGHYVRAYFYYPDNPELMRTLTTSYIKSRDSLSWPLQIEYAGSSPADIAIAWSPTDIPNYIILLHAQDKDMALSEDTSYTFTAESQIYEFNITAMHTTTMPTPTSIPADSSPTTTATPPITPSTTINQTSVTSASAQNITTPTPLTPSKKVQLPKAPGFECISVIIGLLIVVAVMKRRRNL